MIGGWVGYEFAYELGQRRSQHPALAIPVVCLPATINNDLPGTEMTIGADTALNTIVTNVDKVKEFGRGFASGLRGGGDGPRTRATWP